jgi:hypothetical protein
MQSCNGYTSEEMSMITLFQRTDTCLIVPTKATTAIVSEKPDEILEHHFK